jgi:protein-tyrosine phosphatase
MRHLVESAGLSHAVEIDSAGTAGYHAGEPPDPRACAAGTRRGIEICGRARQISRGDFDRFDYVLAMDATNLAELLAMAPASRRDRVKLLRSFDASAAPNAAVPDPYYGGDAGFDEVLAMCLRACSGVLEHVRREHAL